MKHFSVASAVLASLLFVPAQATAQASADEASPWELGASLGVGVNEPSEAFEACDSSSVREAVSLRGAYSARPWLDLELVGTGHADLGAGDCLDLHSPDVRVGPGTYTWREYPESVQGNSHYASTELRAVLDPTGARSFRPLLIAGVGRIWGKGLSFPTVGVGAQLPMGGISLRVEALGRWLSIPYDSVTASYPDEDGLTELSRVRLDEERFPLLFRAGLGWRL